MYNFVPNGIIIISSFVRTFITSIEVAYIIAPKPIDKIVEILQEYLTSLSNRDYMNFSEKYIKLMFYCIVKNITTYRVKSEMEVERKYPDLLVMPKEREKGYASIMIEFKYLKKGEENKLEEKQKEAREQILGYAELEEIRNIERLNMYTIVAVNDRLYVEKVN